MEIEIVCKLYLDCVNMQTKKEYDFAMLFNNPVKNVWSTECALQLRCKGFKEIFDIGMKRAYDQSYVQQEM